MGTRGCSTDEFPMNVQEPDGAKADTKGETEEAKEDTKRQSEGETKGAKEDTK